MSKVQAELMSSAVMTFEDMGFVFAMPELEEEHHTAPFEGAAEVGFSGPFSGRLIISLYGQMMGELAANMMGEDEPPPVQQQHDALGEIANVICGNVLPKVGGSREIFYISAPRYIEQPNELDQHADNDSSVQVSVPLDDGRADVTLFVKDWRFEDDPGTGGR
ncbi:MAG: chemotaxis protein CheX [Armatimonadota bacterium]